MNDKIIAIAHLVVKALKVERGNTISAMIADANGEILESIKQYAIEAGAKDVLLNVAEFGAPINYYFDSEFDVTKSLRIFGGGLSWGMEYEYATDFNVNVLNAISVINYNLSNRRSWLSLVYPGILKSEYSGIDLQTLTDKMFDAILLSPEIIAAKQNRLKNVLQKGKRVKIYGDDVDLEFSIDGRKAVSCSGKYNIPDGEVFVAPVENSMNGTIHFDKLDWGLLQDVTLKFEDGQVTSFDAKTKQMKKWLNDKLHIDDGANKVCEFAIGTNEKVTFMVGDSLWDEKKIGTFHIALGGGYGSNNVSIRHWDLVKDNNVDYTIEIDGTKVLQRGKILT